MWFSRSAAKRYHHVQRRGIQHAATPENSSGSLRGWWRAPDGFAPRVHVANYARSWSLAAIRRDGVAWSWTGSTGVASVTTPGRTARILDSSTHDQHQWVGFLEGLVQHLTSSKAAAEESENQARKRMLHAEERVVKAEAREALLSKEVSELRIQLMQYERQLWQKTLESPLSMSRVPQNLDTRESPQQATHEAACLVEDAANSCGPTFCFLYASPLAYANLALGELRVEDEVKVIDDALQGALPFQVDVATVGSIRKAFSQRNTWLHLSMHSVKSSQSQVLILEKEGGSGHADKLHAAELSLLLQTEQGNIGPELVFVSACESQEFGSIFLKAGAKHVICCSSRLLDSSARRFAGMLYHELANQKSLHTAFEAASRYMGLSGDNTNYMLLSNGSPWIQLNRQNMLPWPRIVFSTRGLPPPVEGFVGRREILDDVLSALQTCRCVVLHCDAPYGLSATLVHIARRTSLPGRLFPGRVACFPRRVPGGLWVVDDAEALLTGDGHLQLRRHLEIPGSALLLGCRRAHYDLFQGAFKTINVELPALSKGQLAEVFLKSSHRRLCVADFKEECELRDDEDAERRLGYNEAVLQLRQSMGIFFGCPGLARKAAAAVFDGSPRVRGKFASLLRKLHDAAELASADVIQHSKASFGQCLCA